MDCNVIQKILFFTLITDLPQVYVACNNLFFKILDYVYMYIKLVFKRHFRGPRNVAMRVEKTNTRNQNKM